MDKNSSPVSLGSYIPLPPPPPLNNLNFSPTQNIKKKNTSVHKQFEDYVNDIKFECVNQVHSAILQEGPTCGLVALSMALATPEKPGPDIKELLRVANDLKYTKQGEMFSAKWMADLATRFGVRSSLVTGGLDTHFQCIVNCLQSGGLVLVPYDSDFNFRPCCKSGHKAHWALIFGVHLCSYASPPAQIPQMSIKCCDCSTTEYQESSAVSPILGNTSDHGITVSKNFVQMKPLGNNLGTPLTIFISAVEGKSIGTMTWPFTDLVVSNNNLAKLCPKRDSETHILPQGGVSAGLKGQAVLLHINRNQNNDNNNSVHNTVIKINY